MSGVKMAYLAACVFSLALASLNVVPISNVMLWRISVVTTEFGHCLFIGAFMLALAGMRGPLSCQIGAGTAVLAALLLISPVVQAVGLARRLPQQMERDFGPLSVAEREWLPQPFSFRTLCFGRKTVACAVQTFPYVEHDGQALQLDFYRAASGRPVPCVLLVHGGGWNTGSRREGVEFDHFLAARGYAVASIDYRLAPASTWPAPRDDVFAALGWLKAHAAELGIDPTRFVIMGRSAGGQIAEAAAYEANDPAIRGCIAFYAPADMHLAFRYAYPTDILDSYHLLIHYLGGTPETVPEKYDSASGILQVKAGITPPTLLLHGKRDSLVWHLQSERLAARLGDAGIAHTLIELPWATHAFDYDRRTPGGQIGAYAVCYFLAAVTTRPP